MRESDAMKALAKGYDLVSSAIERANTAWEENTALQKEADNMAQTTAGQIQITINNTVEAARSIGETFLPIISKGSGTIKDFASDIANMSQESKKRLVDVTTGIITFGAGAKVLSSTAKGIGGFVEGIGKMGTAITGLTAAHPIILALPNAKGTSYFKGGLARINDEKGVSDPRELVEFGETKKSEVNAVTGTA